MHVIHKTPTEYFVDEMNLYGNAIGFWPGNSFGNPHGLYSEFNRVSAASMAKLCSVAIQEPLIKSIVSLTTYKCQGVDGDKNKKHF